jgi:hypothetical protein
MKSKIIKILLAAAIPFIIFSCENFTEVDLPQSQLSGAAVFQDAATANAALADIYSRLRETGVASGNNVSATMLLANYADELDFYGSNTDFEQFNKHLLLPSNTVLTQIWNDSYGQIYGSNALIEGVQKSTAITGENRDRLIGEALFIRAYVHFYLVNLYGDIPYVTTTDYKVNASIHKTPQSQVYTLILNDLEQAESLLPATYPTGERIRANRAVVNAFEARVYLYTEDYIEAENHATAIISNPDYVWEPNPASAFLKDSPSIIWSLHPGIAGLNTNDARTFAIFDGPPFKPTLSKNLYDAFEAGDVRKTLWVKTITDGTDLYYQAFKYKNEASTPTSEEYTILLRLEEQYLIRAEARAHLGNIAGSQDDLNRSRNRAGLTSTTAGTVVDLLMAILNERRFELFTEQGHRWLDLKRTGNAAAALSAIKPGWHDTDLLWPIPAQELVLNGNLLPQNPGY